MSGLSNLLYNPLNYAAQLFITTEKESTPYPLPAGAPQGCFAKGQTNTPINHHNQGEVLTPRIEKTVSPPPML